MSSITKLHLCCQSALSSENKYSGIGLCQFSLWWLKALIKEWHSEWFSFYNLEKKNCSACRSAYHHYFSLNKFRTWCLKFFVIINNMSKNKNSMLLALDRKHINSLIFPHFYLYTKYVKYCFHFILSFRVTNYGDFKSHGGHKTSGTIFQ